MAAKKAMVRRGRFLKIYSLKVCDIWQNFYFYHILNIKYIYSVYISLAKFLLSSYNLSLAMIWQMTYIQKTAKTVLINLNQGHLGVT